MPNKSNSSRKTTKPRDSNGRYIAPEKAVVSRLGVNEEGTPKSKNQGKTITTRHGSTITYS